MKSIEGEYPERELRSFPEEGDLSRLGMPEGDGGRKPIELINVLDEGTDAPRRSVSQVDLQAASPTLAHLEQYSDRENLLGSPVTVRKEQGGKSYAFYEDGSLLITDTEKGIYHFFTAEGRAKGKSLRQAAGAIVSDDTTVNDLRLLGEGKGGFSKVHSLETSDGLVAVKTSNIAGFLSKEMSEALTTEDAKRPYEVGSQSDDLFGMNSRAYVQKMSLKDTLDLFQELDAHGFKRPSFYGFSLRRSPDGHNVQEFQFMEEIARPTVFDLMDTAGRFKGENPEATEIDIELFPHADFIEEMIDAHYEGNFDQFLSEVARGFHQFVYEVKDAIYNIGDISMESMDNVFVTGYDEEHERPEFTIIDPIREQNFYRMRKMPERLNFMENKLLR